MIGVTITGADDAVDPAQLIALSVTAYARQTCFHDC